MSDLDDLEKFADQTAHAVEKKTRAAFAGVKGARKFLEGGRKSIAEMGALRLSAYEPSLPKIKFLEGKDE